MIAAKKVTTAAVNANLLLNEIFGTAIARELVNTRTQTESMAVLKKPYASNGLLHKELSVKKDR